MLRFRWSITLFLTLGLKDQVFFFFLSTYHHRNFKFSLKPYGSDKIRKKIEQCLGNHADDDEVSQDSKATVLLAMSDLLYERFHLFLPFT